MAKRDDLLDAKSRRRAEYLREQMSRGGRVEPPPERDWMAAVKNTRLHREQWHKVDDRVKATYLELLSLSGRIGESARATGCSADTIRALRLKDEEFRELHEEALQSYRDRIEAEVHRRAIEGWEEPVYQKGELVGYITRHSDKMLELLAKRHIPEYTDKLAVDNKHSGGVMVIPQAAMTDDEWEEQEGDKARHGPDKEQE